MRLDRATLEAELAELDTLALRRHCRTIEALVQPGDATQVWVSGRSLRNFCSNDYLGLSAHPALAQAAEACARRLPFGAGAAHLVSGHCSEHQALEEELAEFTGRERALLFSTGYMANLGVLSTLLSRRDLAIADRLSHASLLDGVRLSGAELKRYTHADVDAVARLLDQAGRSARATETPARQQLPERLVLLVTDGVFSMDGDLAPLEQLVRLAHVHGACLLVDDAHGIGVLGTHGRGTLEALGLDATAVPLLIGTLGKALGSFGAFVAGDAVLIDYLLQHARSYIYTTALPPPVVAATRCALRLLAEEPWRRERLHMLVRRFRDAADALDLPLARSSTPIQPLLVGDAARALALSAALMEEGFWVSAIRPPTVPAGSARLRITLSAAHKEADVDALAETLARLWRTHGRESLAPASATEAAP